MKRILKRLSWCIVFIGTIGYPLIARCMENQDEILYKTIFKTGVSPHEGYKILNEGDDFIQIYNQNYNQNSLSSFESLDQNKYNTFIKNEELFNINLSQQKKILNLMRWCQLAGCPLLAVGQYRQFFYTGLHVYTPGDAVKFLGAGELPDEERENLKNEFTNYPYEQGCKKVGIRKGIDDNTYRERDITNDLKDNAIIYLYFNKLKTEYDPMKFAKDGANHYNTPRKAKISYEFLKDYIIPLEKILYIDDILNGLNFLSKVVVDVMRGKAIYLSTEKGVSLNASATSHNTPVATYLGLIPGVFIEHHRKPWDNSIAMTLRNFVHEIGHLIDFTVLQPKLQEDSILFPHQFPQFQSLKIERNKLFKQNPKYKQSKNELCKTNLGYMTNYSESNAAEDFAEHFMHFIIKDFKKKFEKMMKKDTIIKDKYQFMKKMIEETFSERKDL